MSRNIEESASKFLDLDGEKMRRKNGVATLNVMRGKVKRRLESCQTHKWTSQPPQRTERFRRSLQEVNRRYLPVASHVGK